MGLLQLDEGYEDEENYYSDEEEDEEDEEEETDGPDGEEGETEVFINPYSGHLDIVTEEGDNGGDTDTSGSNNTSSGEVTPLVYMEEDEDNIIGLFGLRVAELMHDIEGETGGGGSGGNGVGREKRGRETDKVKESGRRRNATDKEQDHDDGEDDDEEEKPAQVPPMIQVYIAHN